MPSFIIATVFGLWMVQNYAWEVYSNQYWLKAKLVLVGLLIVYHFYCGYLVGVFAEDKNTRSDTFYRWFNEFPVPVLIVLLSFLLLSLFKLNL